MTDVKNSGWISVKDRVPEDERFVLFYVDWGGSDSCCFVGFFSYREDCWLNEAKTDEYHSEVTHWQPLPQPPEAS